MFAVLAASSLTLGALLQLEGDDSTIKFGATLNSPILRASCAGDVPGVGAMGPESFTFPPSAPIDGELEFALVNVAPTCVDAMATKPCAAHSPLNKAYFYCAFTGKDGVAKTGPYKATTELVELHGVKLGIEVKLACKIPAQSDIVTATGYLGDGMPASMVVTVEHNADGITKLPWVGHPMGNTVTISGLYVPPSAPPSPPPPLPPSVPPPPPSPVSPPPPTFTNTVMHLSPETMVLNSNDRLTEWRDTDYALNGKRCIASTLNGGSGSLPVVRENGLTFAHHSTHGDFLECQDTDMHLGTSFSIGMEIIHDANNQAGYGDAWIVQTASAHTDSNRQAANSFSAGPGAPHRWCCGGFLGGSNWWGTTQSLGKIGVMVHYDSNVWSEYVCNNAAPVLKKTYTGGVPGYGNAISIFEFPRATHSGHDALGKMGELVVHRKGANGYNGGTEWMTHFCQMMSEKY